MFLGNVLLSYYLALLVNVFKLILVLELQF
jgi:hypothetical protein